MDIKTSIIDAVKDKWTLDQSVYFSRMYSDVDYPYATVDLSLEFNAHFYQGLLQFNTFSDSDSDSGVITLIEGIKTIYSGASLALSGGYTHIGRLQLISDDLEVDDNGHWQGVLVYKITTK